MCSLWLILGRFKLQKDLFQQVTEASSGTLILFSVRGFNDRI